MVLGFTSNVEKYIKKCSHQQKLWQFLEVVYIALAGKLLLTNVWKSLELGEKPASSGYWNYSKSVVNSNYQYVQENLFTFLHALIMLRRSVL